MIQGLIASHRASPFAKPSPFCDWRTVCDVAGEQENTSVTQEIWQLVDARHVGGIERHIGELTAALGARGIAASAVLYADHPGSPWRDLLRREGTPHRVLGGSFGALRAALREERPALVHTHGYKAGILGRIAGRLAGVPVVSTFHAGERAPWPVGFYQQIDAFTSLFGQRISVSQAIAERLPWRSVVIPNFVALPTLETERPLPRRIAFVGRLSAEKGPDLFCRIARAAGPIARWDVYGDGPMRAPLAAEYGDIVHFHGHSPAMQETWRQIGLLLMPSRAEGLPMAALEALAHGIPVAASAVGGLPSLLGGVDGNWLFEASDIEAAVSTVGRWRDLAPSALASVRLEARRVVEERFSPSAALPAILSAYRTAGWAPGARISTVQSSICSGAS